MMATLYILLLGVVLLAAFGKRKLALYLFAASLALAVAIFIPHITSELAIEL